MLIKISGLRGLCSRRYRIPYPLPRASKARVVLWWKTAVKRITRLLARKAWAAEGLALQAKRIQSLVEGLERRKGVLVRVTKLQSLRNRR